MSKATIAVDAQMLQLLNDRICQTIDALNQVRWSAINNQRLGYGLNNTLPQQHLGYGMSQAVPSAWGQHPATGSFYQHHAFAPVRNDMHSAFGPFRTEMPSTGFGFGPYRSDIPAANTGFNSVYGAPAYNAAPVAGTPVSMGF